MVHRRFSSQFKHQFTICLTLGTKASVGHVVANIFFLNDSFYEFHASFPPATFFFF